MATTPVTSLPTKTKSAVWWLLIIGVIWTIWWNVARVTFGWGATSVESIVYLALLSLFFILLGIFICFKESWAWVVSVAMLCVGIVSSFLICIIVPLYLIPLLLVILDRKKYWEMTRLRHPDEA